MAARFDGMLQCCDQILSEQWKPRFSSATHVSEKDCVKEVRVSDNFRCLVIFKYHQEPDLLYTNLMLLLLFKYYSTRRSYDTLLSSWSFVCKEYRLPLTVSNQSNNDDVVVCQSWRITRLRRVVKARGEWEESRSRASSSKFKGRARAKRYLFDKNKEN